MKSTILEDDAIVKKIMDDLRSRISKVYDKYSGDRKNIVTLPSFEVLSKDAALRYNISNTLVMANDELIEMKLRVSVVLGQLRSLMAVQVAGSDYALIANFKSNLKRYIEELVEVKFDLTDVMKSVNSKIRLVDAVAWNDF